MISSVKSLFGILVAGLLLIATTAHANADSATDHQVNDTVAFIEFAFGFPLDAATIDSIREGLARDMSTNPQGSAATLQDMNTVMAAVRSQPASSNALLRSLIEPQLVAAWQSDTSDPTSRMLVADWRKHNHIIAEGRPPLRRDVAKAFVAMLEFLAKETGKQIPAALANHAQFTSRLARQYAAASSDAQLQFNKVQTLWLALQTAWAKATPADRAEMRQQWSANAAPVSTPATSSNTAQSGFSANLIDSERYKEKLFVDGEAQVMMSTWTNPFNP